MRHQTILTALEDPESPAIHDQKVNKLLDGLTSDEVYDMFTETHENSEGQLVIVTVVVLDRNGSFP
jgi:hypothetical protein